MVALVGCASTDGRRFDLHVQQFSFLEFGHVIIYTATD